MRKTGIPIEYTEMVEDDTAEIIAGRYALIDLEAMIVGSMRRDRVPDKERDRILKLFSDIRRAVDLGHKYAKKERGRSFD